MSIYFPYKKKTIEEGIIPLPVANLPVKTKFGVYSVRFLVDSGADTTSLPISLAPLFGFKQIQSNKSWVSGVEGGKVSAYSSKIEIQFGKKFYIVRCYFIDSEVIALLGRLDIWDKFNWFFDNKRKQVVFERI